MAKITNTYLENKNNAIINIAFPAGQDNVSTVTGFVVHDFNISGGANYTNPLENQALSNLNMKLQAARSIGLEAAQASEGSFLANIGASIADMAKNSLSVGNVTQTLEFWSSSEKPTFNISLVFVALKETDDVRNRVKALFRTVYPEFGSFGIGTTISAPLNFIPSAGGKGANNTVSVSIGRWFKAHSQIMRRVDFTLSKECIANGTPLYAYGSISFSPYRMISAKELAGYIGG